jgi:rare lipoprotein A (peptidoglycan hydrolase)
MKRLPQRLSHHVLTGLAALLNLTLQGCSTSTIPDSSFLRTRSDPVQVTNHESPYFVVTPVVHVGAASWYGPGFSGRKTASGEVFDETKFTAAHKTMPLGTRARVTHLGNGKSVEVVINDRGPHTDGRMIDLSKAAAKALGMIDNGIAKVRIELMRCRDGECLGLDNNRTEQFDSVRRAHLEI